MYREALKNWRSLALLALRRPAEFRDRAVGYADLFFDRLFEKAPDYETTSFEGALRQVGARLGDAERVLREPALYDVESASRRLLAEIPGVRGVRLVDEDEEPPD